MSTPETQQTAVTVEPAEQPKPMSKALVITALLCYGLYLAFSLTRSLYAQCPGGETLSRGWQLADGLCSLVVGGVLGTIAKSALDASDLPQEVKDQLTQLAADVTEIRAESRTVVGALGDRPTSWVSPYGDETPGEGTTQSSAQPMPPGGVTPPEPALLTTREFVLSSGHHVRAKVRKDHCDAPPK